MHQMWHLLGVENSQTAAQTKNLKKLIQTNNNKP